MRLEARRERRERPRRGGWEVDAGRIDLERSRCQITEQEILEGGQGAGCVLEISVITTQHRFVSFKRLDISHFQRVERSDLEY